MKKFCNDCRMYGHRKWLWGGTHFTHRLYIKWHLRPIRKRIRQKEKERK